MKWSKREIALLKLKYSNVVSWTELLSLFPGRTKNSIKKKAKDEDLNRKEFSTQKGKFFRFAMCTRHGRIPKEEILWKGKHLSTPKCPRYMCNRRLTVLPKSSKLRKKYRNV